MTDTQTGSSEMTMPEFLDAYGATCEPCHPDSDDHRPVSIPQLPGWVPAPADAAPGTYVVLVNPEHAAEQWCPNVVLLHSRLSATVDTDELLACAFRDTRSIPGWREYEWNAFPYQGQPSVFVRGVYTLDQRTLSATTRYVVTWDDSGWQYLTQLTVTTLASQAETLDADVAEINVGLAV